MANISDIINDENQVIILLNSLFESFDTVRAAIEYGRDSISLYVVVTTLRSKGLEMKLGNKIMFVGRDALFIRGMREKREFKNS